MDQANRKNHPGLDTVSYVYIDNMVHRENNNKKLIPKSKPCVTFSFVGFKNEILIAWPR